MNFSALSKKISTAAVNLTILRLAPMPALKSISKLKLSQLRIFSQHTQPFSSSQFASSELEIDLRTGLGFFGMKWGKKVHVRVGLWFKPVLTRF
jgi:hypothetical protein